MSVTDRGISKSVALKPDILGLNPAESSINRWTDKRFCLAVTNIEDVWVEEQQGPPQVGGLSSSIWSLKGSRV
jgi:hypothetical protein